MTAFLKLQSDVDVTPLSALLDAHPELWDQQSRRKTAPGTPHAEMSDIWVRYNDDARARETGDWSGFNDRHVPVWYPAWDVLRPALEPLLHDMMARSCAWMLGGVLITRIRPGCVIEAHTDEGWHVDYYDKLYLSVRSARGACFWSGDERITPAPGDLYRFDNRAEHGVFNDGEQERITLIVCVRTDLFQVHHAQ